MVRHISIAALFALFAIAFAGCSSAQTSDVPPREALEGAAERATEVDTFAMELELEMEPREEDGSGGGLGSLLSGAMSITAEGQFDIANDRATFKGDFIFIEFETIIDGDVCYSRSDWTGEKWQKEDPCESTDLMETDAEAPIGDPFTEPAKFANSIKDYAQSVEDMGEAEVRGESARHLRLTMAGPDIEEYAEGDTLPMDVYLDDEGRIVRMEVTFSTQEDNVVEAGDGQGDGEAPMVDATMRMDFFDYGEPVDLDIPSDDEIAEEGELSGSFSFTDAE